MIRLTKGSIVRNNEAESDGGGIYLKSGTVELYDDSVVKENSADRHGDNVFCYNAHVNLYNDSSIDGSSGGVSCVDCYIYEFDDTDTTQKDYCPSNHPSKHSGDWSGVDGYLIFCLVLFIIGSIIICLYCWKKKRGKGSQYAGLLET